MGSLRVLGLMVLGAVVYWVSVVLAMHSLQPEINPIRVPMSAYVLGAYGDWMTTTYFVWSAVLLAVGHGLVRTLSRTRLTRAALSMFLIAAAAVSLAGLFPMDFPPPIRTLSGRLHMLGGLLTFPSQALGVFLFSLAFRRDVYWRKASVSALALSAGIIAVFVLAVISLMILSFAGYAQRLYLILLIAWIVVVGLHLARFPPEESRAGRR